MIVAARRLTDKALELHIHAMEVYHNFNGAQDKSIKDYCDSMSKQADLLSSYIEYQPKRMQ